ncbi:MAG: hypothetical protein JW982_14635 [Spirochaetes bacterium]|nr:hypothetical protein [Spirochaetota bacterium]
MPQRLFLYFMIIVFITGCSKLFNDDKDSSQHYPVTLPSSFPSLTLQGDLIIMKNPEAGTVSVSLQNYNKLYETDNEGNPVYMTSQIVSSFKKGTNIILKEDTGIAVRFKVPQIKKDDYLIIDSEIQLPEEVEIGGIKRDRLIGSFKYDMRNSNKYEYIMIVFNKINPFLFIEGEWQISLYNHDEQLLIQKFRVKK